MKIILPGGSGHVGHILAKAFHKEGHEVVVLSRRPLSVPWRTVAWDGRTLGAWTRELEGADAVINLAGRSVNCRYHARHRREIMESRVDSTRIIGQAISQAGHPPLVWLQSSTATIYEHRFDAPNDEVTGILDGAESDAPDTWRFSIDVATAWEKTALESQPLSRTRLVLLRSAIVMSPDSGGAFDMLLRLVRLGLGGRNGDGRQFVSWIHETDFIRALNFLIAHEKMSGPVNLAAPHPLSNRDFMNELRRAWGARFGLPATNTMLEIGAFFLRTETELILKSRQVVSARLREENFRFHYENWTDAARDLCAQWRRNYHR